MSAVLSAMVEVNWVRAIEVSSWWSTVCIPVPELLSSAPWAPTLGSTYSPGVVGCVEMERIRTLTQAIQMG
jgi:hypothetical protein